jgi:LPS sulfotransferase NodH
MRPSISYTIWFSQRTGSTLLCKALEATGIAGRPQELFNFNTSLLDRYQVPDHAMAQEHLWDLGSTANGVFGCKHSYCEPYFGRLIEELRKFPTCPQGLTSRPAIWECAFPNHRYIFMTRRNKIRLAVSWWKAIKTEEWHLLPGQPPRDVDLSDAYSFDAIQHLYDECSMREAGIQEFLAEGGIVPFNIYYEDFIERYEQTIRSVLRFLGQDDSSVAIPAPPLKRTADELSEEWVQRFRRERQAGWTNIGW